MKTFKLSLIFLLLVLLASLSVPAAFAGPQGPTIVDVAVTANGGPGPDDGDFDTLIAAVLAADPVVVQTLTGNGQFTVFAPTDLAFAEIGLNPNNIGDVPQDVLTNILLFHVARGRRDASQVVTSDQIRMLNGDFAEVDGATIDGANIILTDVFAANGVIHVVDQVLLP